MHHSIHSSTANHDTHHHTSPTIHTFTATCDPHSRTHPTIRGHSLAFSSSTALFFSQYTVGTGDPSVSHGSITVVASGTRTVALPLVKIFAGTERDINNLTRHCIFFCCVRLHGIRMLIIPVFLRLNTEVYSEFGESVEVFSCTHAKHIHVQRVSPFSPLRDGNRCKLSFHHSVV